MKVVDIADEIFRELEQPTDLSIASIAFWLKTNIGNLNTLIGTSLEISTTGEIVTSDAVEITVEEGNIFKQLYYVYWTTKETRKHLGASGTEVILAVDSDGHSVRRANKTTLGSEYRQLAKDEKAILEMLVKDYNQGKVLPRQVAGDDTEAPYYDTPLDTTSRF